VQLNEGSNVVSLMSSDPLVLCSLAAIIFVAGIVRGCIGFAFSALVIAAGSLFLSPVLLVPMVVLLEVAASVQMLPSALPSVHWRAHNWLLAALVLATPIGVYGLAIAPDQLLRLVVALLMLIMAGVMMKGVRFSGDLGRAHLLFVGFVAGLFNGVAGIGGMPIAVYLGSSSISLAQMRATMVALFFGIEALFIVSAIFNHLYDRTIVLSAVAALLPMAVGVWVGTRVFDRVDEKKLRRATVYGLFALALLGLFRAIFSML